MCDDIRLAKTLGVQGVVLGALTKDLQVDQVAMKKMLKEAGNLEKTFHMAIDEAADWKEVAKFCLDNGIQRVLTHGGPMSESVFLHVERLQEMERYHRDLTVVIGGGVRYDNVERLASFFTKAQFHGTKIISIGIKENI